MHTSYRTYFAVFATAALALVGILALFVPAPDVSFSATPVFVDAAGNCDGQTPCFTTIQEGVNNAGPPPAQVNVFPGTYPESVNIGMMGSAIGGGQGAVAIARQENETDTVMIVPPAGSAVWHPGTFTGSVIMDHLFVTSPDSSAIDLVTTGAVILASVVAMDAADNGAAVQTQNSLTVDSSVFSNNGIDGLEASAAGDVTVANSAFDRNLDPSDGDGLDVEAGGNVVLADVSANFNGQEGLDVTMAGGDVTIAGCIATNNGGEGVDIDQAGDDVIVDSCLAMANGSDGFDLGGDGIGGDVIVAASAAINNASEGIDLSLGGTGVVTCVVIEGNSDGLLLNTASMITAPDNWWDSSTGPAHPSNPGGTGQTVIDSANGGAGTVDFTPWLTSRPSGGAAGPLSADCAAPPTEPGSATPTLSPTPTPSPSPSPSPTPAGDTVIWGALLCGADPGSTDALAVLVVLANLSPLPHPDCPAINDEVTVQQGNALARPLGTDPQKWGDVNCSGAADSIDALAILLFVAHLPVPAPPAGCPDIGDEVVISS